MGVALLPRAVAERSELIDRVTLHTLKPAHARVETLFVHRRAAHQYSALEGFVACLDQTSELAA